MAEIKPGVIVILVLHSPREKILGLLREINASGIYLRGIDLNAFDEWTRALNKGEPFFGTNEYFFPMWRVERLTLDEGSFELPSMAEQFRQRTGFDFRDF